MSDKITTFLMFEGKAEEAITFYMSLFENSEILNIQRYGADEAGPEGTIAQAEFTLAGRKYKTIDSPINHAFSFTPAVSLFVESDTEDELERLFKELSKDGEVLMPLDNYGFSTKYGWVNDRFGVSWQLNFN